MFQKYETDAFIFIYIITFIKIFLQINNMVFVKVSAESMLFLL